MRFEETLIYQFAQLSTAQRVSLDKALENAGLFGGQVFILFALWEQDCQSQADLADNLKVSAPAINKMVKSLLEGDLVALRKSPEDARLTLVCLTDIGRGIRETVELLWQEAEAKFSASLTPGERLMLSELLAKIRGDQIAAMYGDA